MSSRHFIVHYIHIYNRQHLAFFLGIDVFDDCSLAKFTSNILLGILPVNHLYSYQNCTTSNSGNVPLLAGLISGSNSKSNKAIGADLRGTTYPVVGITPLEPDLSNKTLYPNFLRAAPNDKLQYKVSTQMTW